MFQRLCSQVGPRTTATGGAMVLIAMLGMSGEAAAESGTAIIQVESRFDHPDVQISFFGAFQGTTDIGESLREPNLAPGATMAGP